MHLPRRAIVPFVLLVSLGLGPAPAQAQAFEDGPDCSAPARVLTGVGRRDVLVDAADLCINPEGITPVVTEVTGADGSDLEVTYNADGTATVHRGEGGEPSQIQFRVGHGGGIGEGTFTIVDRDWDPFFLVPGGGETTVLPFDEIAARVSTDDDPLAPVAVEIVDVDEQLEVSSDCCQFTLSIRDEWNYALRPPVIDGTFQDADGIKTLARLEIAADEAPDCSAPARVLTGVGRDVLVDAADLCINPEGITPVVTEVTGADGSDLDVTYNADGTATLHRGEDNEPSQIQFRAGHGGNIGEGTFTIVIRDWDPFFVGPGGGETTVLSFDEIAARVSTDDDPLTPVAIEIVDADEQLEVSSDCCQFTISIRDEWNYALRPPVIDGTFQDADGIKTLARLEIGPEEPATCDQPDAPPSCEDSLTQAMPTLVERANVLFGASVVTETSKKASLRPSSIEADLRELMTALQAQGCTVDASVQEHVVGVFDTKTQLLRLHSSDGAGPEDGVIRPRARTMQGPLGPNTMGATFSAYRSDRKFVADRSDGGFVAGIWARRTYKTGVAFGLHGTCDQGGDPAASLAPWFGEDLPSW